MKDQHPIDELFRDQLFNRQVEYDANAWNDAEKMLIDEEKKRYFLYRFRYYLSALVLVLASFLTFTFWGSEKESNVLTENTVNGSVVNTEILALSDKSNVKENSRPIDKQITVANNTDGSKSPSEPEVDKISGILTNKSDAEIEDIKGNDVVKRLYDAEIISTTGNSNETPAIGQTSNLNYSTQTIRESSNELFASASNVPMISLSFSTYNDEDAKLKTTDPSERLHEARRRFGLKLIGGIGVTNNSVANEESLTIGRTMYLGLGYERSILNRLSLEVDAVISVRDAMSANYSVTSTEYDFGFITETTQYDFNNLTYLEIPLMLNYHIGAMHHIGVGFQYAHLISSRYTVSYSSESTSMSSEGESVKKNGTSELFSPYNLSLKFNYQYSLNERIQAGLSYQYGLSDVGAERLSLYDSQNDQLRLIITYLLIRR